MKDPLSKVLPSESERSSDGTPDTGEDGFRAYRAPQRHGECLIEPGLDSVPALLKSNVELYRRQAFPDASLKDRARRTMLEDARRYTSSYRTTEWMTWQSDDPLPPILMAGHQPSLFHAGVWFKNFALSRLAQQHSGLAVNLVIDNDVASGCAIRVPVAGSNRSHASYRSIAYDDAGGGVPYEQTTIRNLETFDRFDVRVREAMASLVDEPCITQMWQHARSAIKRCGIAGCALAQARHGLEGDLGLQTLELPLGVVCRTTEFAEFALAILTELPRFHRCYNDAADLYRKAHGIRSSAHPVPNLAEDGEWFEAPMWLYGDDDPQRKPVWVKLSDDHLILSDRHRRERRVDVSFPKLAAEQLASFAGPNFKLRPRALLTTMYARLVLSDLFLHGIGGGKYDQLNDLIIQSFFMVQPPKFMVVSATLTLPGVDAADDGMGVRGLKRKIRETQFQAERFRDEVSLDVSELDRKSELLKHVPPVGSRGEWHRQITELNESLSRQTRQLRNQLREELVSAQQKAAAQNLLANREHPFCLYPLEYLRQTYESMLESHRTDVSR
ncbi:MAG: hypothetical protein AAGG48_29735 [Planctomycetota bacterium]